MRQRVATTTKNVKLQHPGVTKPLQTLVLDHLSMPVTTHPLIQFAINSSVITTVGLSPTALWYHRDIRTPFSLRYQ